ncbi:MAG: arginine--tRNA ligase [Gemmatimonadales bacterium]
MSDALHAELARVARELGAEDVSFVLERPREASHGDLATNLAMLLAKQLKSNPRALAEQIVSRLELATSLVAKTEIAGPGFINFWLADEQLIEALHTIIERGPQYGRSKVDKPLSWNVEFVSANPTGPLHVGHGRGAALGDAIASLLEWRGHTVTREFYVNDAGSQIDKLARSLWARVQQAAGGETPIPDGGYHGQYLADTAAEILQREGSAFSELPEEEGVARCRELAVRTQRAEQDQDLLMFGVRFDTVTSEQALYRDGRVEAALTLLTERDLTYEADGALWLKSSQFGDDQNRVLRKQDGTLTYFVPDLAYHMEKHDRGFDRVIDVWGADHHGYIPRMRAALRALGYSERFFDVALVQLVKIVRGGEEVKMSKRSGDFVTLHDLVEEVGVDAARYFFLMRRSDSQLNFDVDLAKSQTEDNPVFYVQMAHARMSGIFRVAGLDPNAVSPDVRLEDFPAKEGIDLLKKLTAFPSIAARAARELEPHRIASYLEDVARATHSWYHNCRVLGAPPEVERARLALARAARITLANGLTLLGLSAPDRM